MDEELVGTTEQQEDEMSVVDPTEDMSQSDMFANDMEDYRG
jgi:hypothetical protein